MQQRLTKEWVASLTQDDFDHIPEYPSGIRQEERIVDGKRVRTVVVSASPPQWFEEDEVPGCQDHNGQWWRFIREDGKLYKQRRTTPSWAL